MDLSFAEMLNVEFNRELYKAWSSEIDMWDENYITLRLLDQLKLMASNMQFEYLLCPMDVSLKKLKGEMENKFGDILIRVRFHISSGVFVDGFVYYEAKRQYFYNNDGLTNIGFSALKINQLERIGINTTASNVLFYDVLDIKNNHGIAQRVIYNNNHRFLLINYDDEYRKYCKLLPLSLSVSTEIAKAYFSLGHSKKNDRDIYIFGGLWSESLIANFRGLGLDYEKSNNQKIESALGKELKPSFIIEANIIMDKLKIVNVLSSKISAYETEYMVSFKRPRRSNAPDFPTP